MNALQITYRGIGASESLSERIRERAQKLEHFHPRITSCKVVVEEPHRHQRKGRHFQVRLIVHVPGREITIGREPRDAAIAEDAYSLVNDVFDVAERQLASAAETVRAFH